MVGTVVVVVVVGAAVVVGGTVVVVVVVGTVVVVVVVVVTGVSVAVVNGTVEVTARPTEDEGPEGSEPDVTTTVAGDESPPSAPHPRSTNPHNTTPEDHTNVRLKFLNILTLESRPFYGTVLQQQSSHERELLNNN